MIRKAMLILQIFMIVGSTVWAFNPDLLYADDISLPEAELDLEAAPVEGASDHLEYYGTEPGHNPTSLEEESGGSPVPLPLNVDDDLPRTTIASPIHPSGETAPDCLQVRVAAYLPAEAPWDPDGGGSPNFPADRLTQYSGNRVGWDWAAPAGVPALPRPPLDPLWDNFPNGVDPEDETSLTPGPGEAFNGPAVNLPGDRVDVRTDPQTNYQAVRTQRLVAVVHIRNMTQIFNEQAGISCSMDDPGAPEILAPFSGASQVAAGDGQSLIFNSIDLQINSAAGTHQVIPMGRTDFFHAFDGVSLDQAHQIIMDQGGTNTQLDLVAGEIQRSDTESTSPLPVPEAQERYFNDVIGIVAFDVPADAVSYLELEALNLSYSCTFTVAACNAGVDRTDANSSYYVVPLSGPWLYQDGDANTNPPGPLPLGGPHDYNPYDGFNPFLTLHLTGGQAGRTAGENAWFVVEVKNHHGTGTSDPLSVQSIANITNLLECDSFNDPGTPDGWYSNLIIDPITGPQAGSTRLAYSFFPGDTENMALGADEAIFCAFQRELLPDASNNFNFQALLRASSYEGGVNEGNNLTVDIPLSMTFPIAGAEISVSKTITAPLIGNPPEPDRVIPGDIVTYDITITNEGQVDVENLSFIDSLTGPVTFPGVVLAPTESVSMPVQHTVSTSDPNPIFNVVNAFAEIAGTNIVLEAFDSAAILQQDDLLTLSLTARGNNSGLATPDLAVDTAVIYTLNYTNGTDIPFTEIYFTDITPGNPFPRLQNPGSINTYLPNYPTVEVYSDNPPIIPGSVLLRPTPGNPFLPGATYGPIEWTFDLPAFPGPGQPLTGYPLVQEVIMEGIGDNLEVFQGRELLVTEVQNNALDITAQLWNPTTNQPILGTTVLRDETLTFDLNISHGSVNPRCDVFVRMYIRNPETGAETLVNPDIQFDWATPNQLPAMGAAATSDNTLRPTFTVQETSPDPLIVIFEFDARNDCNIPPNFDPAFIERTTLTFDVSNILINTEIQLVEPGTTNPITSAIYPLTGLGNQSFELVYRAVNDGPIAVDIIDWSYCLVNGPISENCASTSVSMYDGQTTGYPDFGVDENAPFGDLSRRFTTFPPRLDNRVITLVEGESYPNPLLIQVILEVTDTGQPTDVTTIRTFVSLPLVSDDLNFDLDDLGRDQLVRGDHGVPINFTFENTLGGGTALENIQVLNLMNLDAGGTAIPGTVPVNPPFGPGPYRLCAFAGGGTTIPTLADGGTGSGQCLFDFTTAIPITNDLVFFQALILATEEGTGRDVFGIASIFFNVVPHIEVSKVGLTGGLPTDFAEYSVEIFNNSEFQYIDFDSANGLTDILDPPQGATTVCLVAGVGPACPTNLPGALGIEHFNGVTDVGGGFFRLPASISQLVPSIADVTYRVNPDAGGWLTEEFANTVTASGMREYDPAVMGEAGETFVSAAQTFVLLIQCPIDWTMNFTPIGADSLMTLGEEVNVTITGQNISGGDINFATLLDLRYQQDVDPAINDSTFLTNVANWPTATPGLLPAAVPGGGPPQVVTWSFTIQINVPDFQVVGPGGSADPDLLWELDYTTDLGLALPGCANSVPGTPAEDDSQTFGLPILYPLRTSKVASPPVATTPGQQIDYAIDIWNISEASDIQVNFANESLFNDLLLFNFPVGGIGTTGTIPAYNPAAGFDVLSALGTQTSGNIGQVPPYFFDPADVNPPGAEELLNTVTDEIEALTGPPWLDLNTPLSSFIVESVLVRNPLQVTESVLLPADGVVSRPGQILYYVTVQNTSDQYPVLDITLSNIHPLFNIPVCNVTPGFDAPPIDLNVTPDVCLEFEPFDLDPGESDSVVVTIDIPGNFPDPDVVTQTIADGTVFLLGPSFPIQGLSNVNQVLVETPALTLVHDIYAGPTCSTLLVDVVTPDRDKNDDGIPELEVGGTFFYGVSLFVGGNRIYDNVQYSVNMFNGITTLTQAVQNALLNLAIAGTNPNVTTPDNATVTITDNGNPDATVPEVTLCLPQPFGYAIPASQPDPLFLQATISGQEQVSGEPSLFITNQDPNDDVEDDEVIDVTDPNIFISKSVSPSAAFPGETVLYTLQISNLTQTDILLNDVYDNNIGVGQQFWDHDSNPATPPVPVEFHNVLSPPTSIDFFKHVDTSPDGLGWDWEDVGPPGGPPVYNFGVLPANGTVTYTYERLITQVDPNPLVNRAGLVGFIDNPDPNPDTQVQDETIATLVVSNSQLNVVKTATPVSTVLGTTIAYTVNITNIGDDAIYDVIVWDDRFNLEHSLDAVPPIELLPNTPPGVLVFGTEFFTSIPGADDAKPDIGGQLDAPNISKTITLQYTLPVPPACLEWTGQPNTPFNIATGMPPGNVSSSCADATFDYPLDLSLIDPFVNTAYAVGLIDIDPGPGITLDYLEDVGFDLASVDIINPDLTLEKIPDVGTAAIGADVNYTIRLTNTGDNDLRIDSVVDVPNAGVPPLPTDSVQLPIQSLVFGDCPISVPTNPGGTTNLLGTQLVPTSQGGDPDNTTIVVDNTAVLPPGCTVEAIITVQVQNPLPSNEYINVVLAEAVNLQTGEDVSDITSARIDINVSGLEITKRAWNCDTASNGGDTPIDPLPDDPTSVCTIQTPSGVGPLNPGAVQLNIQDEGRDVYFELSLLNSGQDILTSIQITDVMMVNQGAGLVPNTTRIANGTPWADANGEIYTWLNGQLIIGVANYAGFNQGPCGNATGTHLQFDDSYACEPGYRGYNLGPFGNDDTTTTDRDESYLFAPGEQFERPDPGPVDIPVITYPYTVDFNDDLDGDSFYINRARVVGTAFDPLVPDISNLSIHFLEMRPATVILTLEACVEDDGDTNYYDPDLGNPCVTVARPGQTVWYRMIIQSAAFVPLANVNITATQIAPDIPNTANSGDPIIVPENIQCWYDGVPLPGVAAPDFVGAGVVPGWPGGTPGRLPQFGDTAVCTFHRTIPLQVNQDPFVNTVSVDFEIEAGLPPFNPGTTVTEDVVTRIAANELLLTVPGCETGIQAMSGDSLTFDIEVLNIDPLNPITNVDVFIPQPVSNQIIPVLNPNDPGIDDTLEGSQVTLVNALQIQVPQFGPPSTDYIVLATGTIGPRTINASFTCTVQRVDGALNITKSVVNLTTGGTTALPGDTVRYTITVENVDPFIAVTNLVISDPLIEAEIGGPAWNAAWPQAPNDFLLPSDSITNSFDVVVTGIPDPLINTVTATGIAAGVTPVINADTAQVNITSSDLVVTASGLPNPVIAGNNIIFTYQVCNLSDSIKYELTNLGDNDPGAALLPGLPNGTIINEQECLNFTRTVATTPADAGTIITRTAFAEGCPTTLPPFNCPLNQIASDSQGASVLVISQPSATGVIDVRLTSNVIGVSPGDTVIYTATITNLNTLFAADVTLPTPSLLGNFDPATSTLHNVTIPPLGSITEAASYFVAPATPDPLVETLDVDYLMGNGTAGTASDTLSVPIATIPGATVLLSINSVETEGTPGGQVTYQYVVTNIGSIPVYDAYLYDLLFIPATTPSATPSVACNPATATDIWGLGHAAAGGVPVTNFLPTLFSNGFSRTATVICDVDPSFQLTTPPTNLLQSGWVNRDSIDPANPSNANQDQSAHLLPIVPPLDISMTQPYPAVPGGPLEIEFTVTNIGPVDINNAVLTAAVPPECVEAGWATQTPSGPGSLWDALGVTVPVGGAVTATATCTIPADFLSLLGVSDTTFDYPGAAAADVSVDLQGNVLDIATPLAVRVVDPVQVTFIPPANNPTMAYLLAGDVVPLTFHITNILPAGSPVDGLTYVIDINGNTAACENVIEITDFGTGAFNGTLPDQGNSVDIICNYRPPVSDHGTTQVLTFTLSHMVNGNTIPLTIAGNPFFSAMVEDVDLEVTLLTGTGSSANVADGEDLQFTWTVRNTGQTPLTGFSFSQNMLDSVSGAVVTGKANLLTSAAPTHGLVDVFNQIVSVSPTCSDPLLPGETCAASAGNPTVLVATTDLSYTVLTTDPQQFLIRVLGDATTSTGSGFTVMDTAEWRGTVERPMVQLCGNGPALASNSRGNQWSFEPNCLSINPNPVVLGNDVNFSATITNIGSQTISNMTLKGDVGGPVAFDGGLSLTSGLYQTPPTTVTFTLGATSLAPGASTTATATWTAEGVTPPATVPFTTSFTGSVPAPYTGYSVTSDATNIQIVQDPTLPLGLDASATEPIVTKTASTDTAFPGESLTWTITITNMSTADMPSVDMTDNVPGDLEIVSATTSSGASIVNGQLIDITTGTLSPGEAVTVTINTNISPAAPVPSTITNVACGMREGGTEVCAEASVELGPGGILPDTGIGGAPASIGGGTSLAQRLPFAVAIFGVFFSMLFLSLNMSDRQRMGLAVLALMVMAVVISGVLLLAGGDGEEEATVPIDGDGPPDALGAATATPVPSATVRPDTPTPPPTVAPDALATIAAFPATATPYIVPTPAGPRRLDIPSLNYAIPLPIVELPQINGEWDVTNLGHNIGWLDNTTWQDPLWGNTVLAGHVQLADTDPGPFSQLHRLVPGDEIRIMEGDNITIYQVSEIFEVGPTDNSVTHPTDDPMLTLITCTNWVDNRGVFADRLVVRAVPVGTN